MADFKTTRGMLLEPLEVQLTDYNGDAVSLQTASLVQFRMVSPNDLNTTVVSGAMSIIAPATDGKVRYEWSAPDVAAAGYFYGQVIVTWSSGKQQAFPSGDDYLTISIVEDLG
jgi:hypothetical protein